MSNYTLPKLRYEYSALEPYISKRILELHHDQHHATYVKNANAAAGGSRKGSREGRFRPIACAREGARLQPFGPHHALDFFWQNMTPRRGRQARG